MMFEWYSSRTDFFPRLGPEHFIPSFTTTLFLSSWHHCRLVNRNCLHCSVPTLSAAARRCFQKQLISVSMSDFFVIYSFLPSAKFVFEITFVLQSNSSVEQFIEFDCLRYVFWCLEKLKTNQPNRDCYAKSSPRFIGNIFKLFFGYPFKGYKKPTDHLLGEYRKNGVVPVQLVEPRKKTFRKHLYRGWLNTNLHLNAIKLQEKNHATD